MRFGAIDIGTNAARLLIGEVAENVEFSHVKKVSYTRIPLRLGESVFEFGKITEGKYDQFTKTIQAFKLISEIFDVKELRACATSAMREAENSDVVRASIFEETGIDIEIISGDEEAHLIFSTFFLLNIDKSRPFLVIDVGGGSTEISIFKNGERVTARSFKIGTIRLLKSRTEAGVWESIHEWLKSHVDFSEDYVVYATGGNINKAHKILGANHMEPLSLHQMQELRNELHELNVEERITRYQLKPDRADVLVPALNIYLYILEKLNCREILVPKIGLSDGIIYNLHLKHSDV